jgi:transcriptional regulator with XRE-family HTH domain
MQVTEERIMSVGKLFGARVKAYRQALRLKQEAVGLAIGCSTSTISEIESGKHTPHLEKALALARFFGVSVEVLATEEKQDGMSPCLAAMRQMARTIPYEHRVTMADVLVAFAEELKAVSAR